MAGMSVWWRRRVAASRSVRPAGSGAPAHYHKAAVNTVVYGRKRWWLFPPAHAFFTRQAAGAWVDGGGPNRSRAKGTPVLECVQRAGESLYLPDYWGHATLNLEPTLAVASEIYTPRSQFEFRRE